MEKREIKFRAFYQGQMFEVTELLWSDGTAYLYDRTDESGFIERMDNIKLMQFTGLRDRNGVEVYEGDIVACQSMRGDDCLHEVIWDGPRVFGGLGEWHLAHLAAGARYDWLGGEEIRGNIYENPDLLSSSSPEA